MREAVIAAIIRIGNLIGKTISGKIKKQPHLVPVLRSGEALQIIQIVHIHRQNQIEMFKITAHRLPSHKVGNIIAVTAHFGLRPMVGRRADMPVAGAG